MASRTFRRQSATTRKLYEFGRLAGGFLVIVGVIWFAVDLVHLIR